MLMETLECCELLNYFCQVQYMLGSQILVICCSLQFTFPIIIKLLQMQKRKSHTMYAQKQKKQKSTKIYSKATVVFMHFFDLLK